MTDPGEAESLNVTERAALRAWTFSVMRTIEDMASLIPRCADRVRTMQYAHEILVRALDEAEEQSCPHR